MQAVKPGIAKNESEEIGLPTPGGFTRPMQLGAENLDQKKSPQRQPRALTPGGCGLSLLPTPLPIARLVAVPQVLAPVVLLERRLVLLAVVVRWVRWW